MLGLYSGPGKFKERVPDRKLIYHLDILSCQVDKCENFPDPKDFFSKNVRSQDPIIPDESSNDTDESSDFKDEAVIPGDPIVTDTPIVTSAAIWRISLSVHLEATYSQME